MSKIKSQRLASWLFGGGSFLVLLWVFFFGPDELPPQKHLILGLIASFAAGFLGYFLTGVIGINANANLPKVGKITIKAIGGIALFVLVLLWWRSGLSPTKVSVEKTIDETHRVATQIATQQSNQATKEDLGRLAAEVRSAIETSISKMDPNHERLSSEIVAKARVLLERGDLEQMAIAQTALGNYDSADEIIQGLKKDTTDDAVRILMLEGDNWYRAGQFARAIDPYERALGLRPKHIALCSRLTICLRSLYHDPRTPGSGPPLLRSVRMYERSLDQFPGGSHEWSILRSQIERAWYFMPVDDRATFLRREIEDRQRDLKIHSRDTSPMAWAKTQMRLGDAWSRMPPDYPSTAPEFYTNQCEAISAYEAALTVYSKTASPYEWAVAHMGLAQASGFLFHLPVESPEQRVARLRGAIAHLKAALLVFPYVKPEPGSITDKTIGENLAVGGSLDTNRQYYEGLGGKDCDSIQAAD